ncbi:unnamed protein product [Schistocephalus solidus]|uniref:Zinc finger protein n=1 Tax=Schistocephalus solidus TaxID=70667 RepID=A0A183T8T8_SCHSO|nr:unnamed protein product [Schistocephalus solidus]
MTTEFTTTLSSFDVSSELSTLQSLKKRGFANASTSCMNATMSPEGQIKKIRVIDHNPARENSAIKNSADAHDTDSSSEPDSDRQDGERDRSLPYCVFHSQSSSMDPSLRSVLGKYIRSEYVINCLELAGFDSPAVVMCLNDSAIKQVEEFVITACSLMASKRLRARYLGPVFARHPSHFRLPAGVICGIRLAIEELRRTQDQHQSPTMRGEFAGVVSQLRTPSSTPSANYDENCSDSYHYVLTDAVTQTHLTLSTSADSGCWTSTSSSTVEPHSSSPILNEVHLKGNDSPQPAQSPSSPLSDVPNVQPSFDQPLSSIDYSSSSITNPSTSVPSSEFLATARTEFLASHLNENTLIGRKRILDELTLAPCSGFPAAISESSLSASSLKLPAYPQFQPDTDSNVDLSRLIEHSSASACRLAARQFVNAKLVRGEDFDIQMEVSSPPGGSRRITGIFYCHLCREKRERTCAVRFSVARNRYPVLSNVISHLRTHFHHQTANGQPTSVAASMPSGKSFSRKSGEASHSPTAESLLTAAVSLGSCVSPTTLPMSCAPPPLSTNTFLSQNPFCDLMSQVVHLASTAAVAAAATTNTTGPAVVIGSTSTATLQPKCMSLDASESFQPRQRSFSHSSQSCFSPPQPGPNEAI